MKLLFICLFPLILFSTFAQEKNTLTTDEKTGKQMLIGFIDRSALVDTMFSDWFAPEYKEYEVDIAALDPIVNSMDDVTVTIVLGTWCSDSHQQVPRFLKILDVLNFNYQDKLTLIAVDRNKAGLGDETAELNIKAVPTFIIFRNDVEIGRIVETPIESLEKDFVSILQGKEVQSPEN